MTIVASNRLTLSNVNDGTITHTAYSYSADGTNRFTTTYPNLNLLEGSNSNDKSWILGGNGAYTGQYVPFNGGYKYNFTYTRASTDWAVYMFSGLQKDKFKPDTDYVLSFMANVSTDIKPGVLFANAPAQHNFVNQVNNPTILSSKGDQKVVIQLRTSSSIPSESDQQLYIEGFVNKVGTFSIWDLKIDPGSIATPHMPSESEVKTSDYPNFIGQYTNLKKDDSTNPSDYTWSLIRGNDGKDGLDGHDGRAGKDGVGIKTTVITYAISTSGTTAPTGGWTSSVPSLVKGQYLWTKTVWTYTDNTSETGYSVSYIAQDGNNGHDGIAGKDGTGIKTTTITYAGSTSGTTAPTSGWATTVPTVAAGSYLWTKTVWAYTDNTSETGYSVAKMGNNGATGPQGPPGSNGDPGKTVSNTEPTTRFKGLTWKYSGTTDLTASDGTVIHPNTEYYYNGTHWMINYLSANNLEANSITADLIDGKNLTITDGEFVSTTTNGPVTTSTEIKDNHIAISKTDGTVNTRNDIALDSEQGLAQKFTNINTGFYRTAGINYQGPFTSDSDGNYAQLTPQGTKLSTDVPWTDITRASGVGTSGTLRARINNGVFYAQSKDVTIPSIAPNSLITIGTMSSKFSGVSGFDTLGLLYSPGQLSVASVTVGNDGKINIGNPNPTTMSGKVIQFSINIPLG